MKIRKEDFIKILKECVLEEIEKDENALYVEYLKELPGEEPFTLQGQKFQYVLAKYPSGKKDIPMIKKDS